MSDERHIGLLFGISHPGPQEGCGYCIETLRAVGITTLADAYLAGARDGRALGLAEYAHERHGREDLTVKQCGICSRLGHTSDEHQAYVHTDDEQEGKQ